MEKRYWLTGGIVFVVFASILNILLSFSYGINSSGLNIIRLFNLNILSTIPIYINYLFFVSGLYKASIFKYIFIYIDTFWIIAVCYWFLVGSIMGMVYSAIKGIKENNTNL